MRKTNAESFDVAVLEKRIAVSDKELAFMLANGKEDSGGCKRSMPDRKPQSK